MPFLLSCVGANVPASAGCENNQFPISIEAGSISLIWSLIWSPRMIAKNATQRGRILAPPEVYLLNIDLIWSVYD